MHNFFKFIKYHSTCFGQSLCLSSGVPDRTYSFRYMSCRFVDCLLAGMRWNSMEFHLIRTTPWSPISCPLASSQRSFRPSSKVRDRTFSFRYMSYRFVDCLLAGTRWNSMEFHLMPASKQSTNLHDIYLKMYVRSRTPDDGRRDRPKHVV
jgi:hypothetical protein